MQTLWLLVIVIHEEIAPKILSIKFATQEHCNEALVLVLNTAALNGESMVAFCLGIIEEIAI